MKYLVRRTITCCLVLGFAVGTIPIHAVRTPNQPHHAHANDPSTLLSLGWSSNQSRATTSVAWGDVDSDGDLDLAVGTQDETNQLYRNDNGTLNQTPIWSSTESDTTSSLAWGDMDKDGDLDLVAANFGQPLRMYRNTNGTLSSTAFWSSDEKRFVHNLDVGDYDNDNDLDLAVAAVPDGIFFYRNNAGTLPTTATHSIAITQASSVAWGDMNNDGKLDLAVGANSQMHSDPTKIFTNTNNTFPAAQTLGNDKTMQLAWGDMDNDGDLDLALGRAVPTQIGTSHADSIVYRNDQGRFVVGWTMQEPITNSWSFATMSLAWGDIDNDDDLDLMLGNRGTGTSNTAPNRLYVNTNGTLSATAAWVSAESDDTRSVAWGDIDNDGDLDLAVGNYNQPIRIYLNSYQSPDFPVYLPLIVR